MRCRHCGTEIAGNALICYRCGTAVEELPVRSAVRPPRRVGLVGPALALIVILLAAWFLGGTVTPQQPRALFWTALVLAVMVVGYWLLARRRG